MKDFGDAIILDSNEKLSLKNSNSYKDDADYSERIYNKFIRIRNILEKEYNTDSTKSSLIINLLFVLKIILKNNSINHYDGFKIKQINVWLKELFDININSHNDCEGLINYITIFNQYGIDISQSHLKKINELISTIDFDYIINNSNYSDSLLGQVFEKIITKKEIGAYYTSELTTKYITNNSVIPSIVNSWANLDDDLKNYLNDFYIDTGLSFMEYHIKNNIDLFEVLVRLSKTYDSKKLSDVVNDIKIVDISCGSGSFVFYSLKLFVEINNILNNNNYKASEILRKNLYGIDIDEEAISILKFRIFINLLITDDLNTDISSILNNFSVGNSLLDNDKKSIFKINSKFKNIIMKGGFDVVLGNPPYLEYRKVKNEYKIESFVTEKCNNLYAYILEKNFDILKENGHLGVIVPISYISTKRMHTIRNLLSENSKYQFCSSFADRPSSLFNGVHQKLNIILLEKQTKAKDNKLYTSNYIHWYKNEKNYIFDKLEYIENPFKTSDYFFKIGNSVERNIIKKLCYNNNIPLIDNTIQKSEYRIWLNMRMCFWNKSFSFFQKSNEYKVFCFKNEIDSLVFSAFLNSNIFFFYWECISDVWHITAKELHSANSSDIDHLIPI